MKRVLIAFTTIALACSSLTSCKKGDNDPFFSLKSRTGRLTGDWVLSTQESTSKDVQVDMVANVVTITITNRSISGSVMKETVEVSQNGVMDTVLSTVNEYGYTLTNTIDKDGTFIMIETLTLTKTGGITIPPSFQVPSVTTTIGNWMWVKKNKEGEIKNKEGVVFSVKSIVSTGLTTPTNHIYTGFNNASLVLIDRLKNKEMITKINRTSDSSAGSSTAYSDITTFTKS